MQDINTKRRSSSSSGGASCLCYTQQQLQQVWLTQPAMALLGSVRSWVSASGPVTVSEGNLCDAGLFVKGRRERTLGRQATFIIPRVSCNKGQLLGLPIIACESCCSAQRKAHPQQLLQSDRPLLVAVRKAHGGWCLFEAVQW